MASILRLISSVAFAVSLANSFTSFATTAKPCPLKAIWALPYLLVQTVGIAGTERGRLCRGGERSERVWPGKQRKPPRILAARSKPFRPILRRRWMRSAPSAKSSTRSMVFASTIATAVEEQNATTNEMARNIGEAARGGVEITSNISGVSEAAASTSGAELTDARKAAQGLVETSRICATWLVSSTLGPTRPRRSSSPSSSARCATRWACRSCDRARHEARDEPGQAISCCNFGGLIAEGMPAEIRANPVVVEAYLGSADSDEKAAG